MTVRRIVVAVDGSDNSRRAAAWAADLAAVNGAEVVAIHALGLLEHAGATSLPAQHHRAEITWAFEHSWTEPLRRPGVEARCLLRDGPPAPVILEAAAEVDADLVVIGSRGTGEHGIPTLGSTSTYVVQHSTCPVTVIPHR